MDQGTGSIAGGGRRSPSHVEVAFGLAIAFATLASGGCGAARAAADGDSALDRAAAVGKVAAQVYVGTAAGAPVGVGMALGELAQDQIAARRADGASLEPGSVEAARETAWGREVTVGQGTARVYVETVDGQPVEVGVALSERALEGLPDGHHGGVAMPDGHRMFEFLLELPEGNPTPFRHVLLNWNPGGHEPPGIYDHPHFDFHFYTITNEERTKISPEQPGWAERAGRFPAGEHIPRGYLDSGTLAKMAPEAAAVPGMGMHWLDPTSPELNGKPFTTTFIFGSWDGQLTFAEPMITKAFLESRVDFRAALPFPAAPAEGMYYPASYRVRWDETTREHRISLGGPLAGS